MKLEERSSVKFLKVGAKTALGAGAAVVTAVFATIAATQVLEVALPAILITKAAGVVGAAAGLIKGIGDAHCIPDKEII